MGTTDEKIPFAVYSAEDRSLTFYAEYAVPAAGESWAGKAATDVYTGFAGRSYAGDGGVRPPWDEHRADIVSVATDPSFATVRPVSTAYWFEYLVNCTDFDLGNIDTSHAADMSHMLAGCSSLGGVSLLTGLDVGDGVSADGMFEHCL